MNFRMTRQRRIILEELKKLHSHPTADQVYQIVRERIPRISLGTVYRNLGVLAEFGHVQVLEFGNMQRRFDGSPGTHYHVLCTHCGRVEDVPAEPIPAVEEAVREMSDWEITRHRLKFFGVCPECREKIQKFPMSFHRRGERRNGYGDEGIED